MGFFQSNEPPPPPRPRCVKQDASVVCDGRLQAQRAGEMIYDRHAYRWRFPVDPLALRPHTPPFAWTFCPFCGGELPTRETLRAREEWRDGQSPTRQADGEGAE